MDAEAARTLLSLTSAQLRMTAVMLHAVQSTLVADSALRADLLAIFGHIVNTYEWLQREITAPSASIAAAEPGDVGSESRDAVADENSNQSADAPFFH